MAISILLGLLLTHKSIVPFLAQKYAKEYGVVYSKIEGTLLFGFEAHDVKYENFMSAKSIFIRYDFFSILRLSPIVSKFKSDSLYINIDKIPLSDSNKSSRVDMELSIARLLLKNTKIEYEKEVYSFNADVSELYFKDELSAKKIALLFKSSYGEVDLNGFIVSNELTADTTIKLSPSTSKEYLHFLQTPPKMLKCKLHANTHNIKLSTEFKTLKLKEVSELEFKDVVTRLNYSIEKEKLNGDFQYQLIYDELHLQANQNIRLDINGNFSSKVDSKVIYSPLKLPFQKFRAKASGNSEKIAINIDTDKIHYRLKSDDYKRFLIDGEVKDLKLAFIKELPQVLKEDRVSFTNNVELLLSPLSLNSTIEAESLHYSLDAELSYKEGEKSALLTLNPKSSSSLFEGLPIDKFSPLSIHYIAKGTNESATVEANLLKMKLLKRSTSITGEGTLASNPLALAIELNDQEPLELQVDTEITSYKKMLQDFNITQADLTAIPDFSLDVNSTLILSEPITLKSSVFVPSVLYKADEQTTHLLRDIRMQASISNNILTLESYDLKYKTHSIYSNKSSKILLSNNSDILFKEFWIFDNLQLNGIYKMKSDSGSFSLKGENFHYKDENADLNVNMNLNAHFDANRTKLMGNITLLDGNISYMPVSDYSISDPDIIMVQETKKRNKSDILMDIKIDSSGDILYLNKNANIFVRPDIRLLKTSTKDMHLEGMISIEKGELNLSDKKFIFDKSELYFDGGLPLNPKLNLNLHHYTLDYIDILISVTHTLEEPVFIFSSNPSMSQNDIMSYILFGESADSMFNSSSDSSKTSLLLGSGMKELINLNSSVKIDTLNILTNSDGSFGYEIGSRINKRMRIVYKNDTVSSVILQYSLNKSTRVDVDIREAGQGVSLIYLRDY